MTGWQPYSLKIGDTYYSYARGEPLGTLVGVAADMFEVAHAATTDENESVAKLIFASISKNLTSKTWLKGPSDLIEAVTDSDRYGQRYLQGMAGTVVPAFAGQAAGINDPYLREARSILDSIKARIPGVSETLFPRRDVWGQAIERGGYLGYVSGIAEARINNDPTNQALIRAGAFPAKLSRKIRGVELNDEQYDEYGRLAGGMAKMRADAIARMPGLATLPLGTQRELLLRAVSGARESARGIMMMKHPEIVAGALEVRRAQLRGEHPKITTDSLATRH